MFYNTSMTIKISVYKQCSTSKVPWIIIKQVTVTAINVAHVTHKHINSYVHSHSQTAISARSTSWNWCPTCSFSSMSQKGAQFANGWTSMMTALVGPAHHNKNRLEELTMEDR